MDTESRTTRATAASSAARRRRRLERLAAELRQSGYFVAEMKSGEDFLFDEEGFDPAGKLHVVTMPVEGAYVAQRVVNGNNGYPYTRDRFGGYREVQGPHLYVEVLPDPTA